VVVAAAATRSPVTVPATVTWPPLATRSPSMRPSIRTVPAVAIRSPCTLSPAGMVSWRPLRTLPPSSACWAAATGERARASNIIAFISELPSWAPSKALGRGPGTAVVVGDDLAADIGGGRAVGAATVLVRSGKGDRPQPGADAEPDAAVDSIAGLPGLLQG
jgi:hypothetical protein